jgi:hypothetical protein
MSVRNDSLSQRLIGSWHLVKWQIEYMDGHVTLPFGDDAGGVLIYAGDGWMSAAMWRSERTALDAEVPAQASMARRAAVLDEYLAYGGRWHVEGDTVVHRVAHAGNPALINTVQRRRAELCGAVLRLEAREGGAKPRVHRIEWRRYLD